MNLWFVAGIVIFAFGLFISVCIHEAGHMLMAKTFGMKVTRYFAGFGPTLWSFKRGETEYGIKAIPAGGFVKIVGMTPHEDDLKPEDEHRAFYKRPLWQRTIVLAAGSVTHFIIGFILLWVVAVFVGMPNQTGAPGARAEIGAVEPCVQQFNATEAKYQPCKASDPVSPAKKAGLRAGDVVIAVNGSPVADWSQMAKALGKNKTGPVTLTYERDGQTRTAQVTPVEVARPKTDAKVDPDTGAVSKADLENARVISVTRADDITVGALAGIGSAGFYTKEVFVGVFEAIKKFPEKVPKLIEALTHEERDPETPISVVGASRLGGEAAQASMWSFFFFLLASFNIFVGIFNLIPLLPLDGGHVAIAWFEKARFWWAAKRGKPNPGHVNYQKLMPLTYVVILVFGSISLLTIITDVVNPISIIK